VSSSLYLARRNKRCHGTNSERLVAKRLGGRTRPASGALEGCKGDVELNTYLLEAKSTIHKSMSVKLDWLLKIEAEALAEQKMPALSVTFVDATGSPVRGGKWVLVRESEFRELTT